VQNGVPDGRGDVLVGRDSDDLSDQPDKPCDAFPGVGGDLEPARVGQNLQWRKPGLVGPLDDPLDRRVADSPRRHVDDPQK